LIATAPLLPIGELPPELKAILVKDGSDEGRFQLWLNLIFD